MRGPARDRIGQVGQIKVRVGQNVTPGKRAGMRHFTLLLRINVALVMCFTLALVALALEGAAVLRADARYEALREAELMMGSALAIRDYTAAEIVPLLAVPMHAAFLPQSIPSYAATQHFLKLREAHPEYAYKEATLNPTNPRDRAADWEADLVQRFRNSGAVAELSGERDTPMGRALYVARPIRAEAECLACHGLATAAPRTLLERYGPNNGFGWQPREVIGAQIVSVPLSSATERADRELGAYMAAAAGTLVTLLLATNLVLYAFLIRPLRRAAAVAEQLSRGEPAASAFPATGGEIGRLVRAFERLRTSLEKSLRLLGPA